MPEDTLPIEQRPMVSRECNLSYDNRFFAGMTAVSLAVIFLGFARTGCWTIGENNFLQEVDVSGGITLRF
jgi:hypothetical protein